MTLLTFVIPVRHQDNARDWSLLKANLAQTVASIANQTNGDWRAIIVANHGADLPGLPERFGVERVDFPSNDMHELGSADREVVLDAFRADKGRRVLKGMLAARDCRFFMIVDDDDFVSANLVQYVSENSDASGWTIDRGYIWDDGGRLLLGSNRFNHLCGTCLVVPASAYDLPARFEDASLDWIKSMLGSHVQLPQILAERGTPLKPLPFRGAVYRVANRGSHSQAPSLLVKYFLSWEALRQPVRVMRNLTRLRLVDGAAKREFFGKRRAA
jgi:hypothetical protein